MRVPRKRNALKQAGVADFDLLSNPGDVSHVNSILEFDDAITPPLNDFSDASDYCERCCSINFLPGITAPTLLIQASGDPLIPAAALPDSSHLYASARMDLSVRGACRIRVRKTPQLAGAPDMAFPV